MTELVWVWCTAEQAWISLVTVEREVRVYSLVVSDPMLRILYIILVDFLHNWFK